MSNAVPGCRPVGRLDGFTVFVVLVITFHHVLEKSMPSRRKKNKQKRGKSKNKPLSAPPISDKFAQHGRLQFSSPPAYRFVARQIQTGVSSDGAGTISIDIGLNAPSSATNWSAFAGLFDQFRVRQVKVSVHVIPNVTTPRPMYVVVDYDNTAMAGINTSTLCMSYHNCLLFDIGRDFDVTIKVPPYAVSGIPGGWIDLNSPIANGRCLLFASALAISTVYLQNVLIEYDIDFRSMR